MVKGNLLVTYVNPSPTLLYGNRDERGKGTVIVYFFYRVDYLLFYKNIS